MRIAHFDCVSGIAGDMTLAALVSAGWPVDELERLPARLGLEGVDIVVSDARRGPFAARHVAVRIPDVKAHRHLHHIEAILDRADLPPEVRERARAVFRRLAAAEAEVHGTSIQKVHFHEVGAVDAIIDIVGSIAGLHALGVEQVTASELPLGGGWVDSEHGRIPVPAPATTLLLRGIPVRGGPVDHELVTPTGAALLAELASSFGALPAFTLRTIGTGAGTADFPNHPNVLRVLIGETSGSPLDREIAVLETAVDDESPQTLGALIPRLLSEGALDAMLVPALMKKGRPGHWLILLCETSEIARFTSLLLEQTSSLGVRWRTERRTEAARREGVVMTRFGEVRVKLATLPSGLEKGHPEFESALEVSGRTGASVRDVMEAAKAALLSSADASPGARSDERGKR